MAKFCKYCGKELKAKEQCTCLEKVQSKNSKEEPTELKKAAETITKEVSENGKKYAKQIWELCQNILIHPKQTAKEFLKKNDWNLTILLLVLTSLFIGLSTVSFLKGFMVEGFSWNISSFLSSNRNSIWTINYLKILICVALGIFLSYMLLAIIFDLGFEKISKTKLSFRKALNTIAISALEPTIYIVLGAFLTIISYKLAFIMIIYAALLYLINLYQNILENSEIEGEHYNHIFGLLLLLFLFLAIYLIPKLFI